MPSHITHSENIELSVILQSDWTRTYPDFSDRVNLNSFNQFADILGIYQQPKNHPLTLILNIFLIYYFDLL